MKSEIIKCRECEKDFLITVQEMRFYALKKLSLPINCMECRRKRRQALRNKHRLYKRVCFKCKEELMSSYDNESLYTIYCEQCYLNSD